MELIFLIVGFAIGRLQGKYEATETEEELEVV